MDPLENPYRPGAGARPPALTGRDDLISGFAATVAKAKAGRPGQSLIPIGLRGVGKTVLLNRFADDARAAGAHVAYVEAGEDGHFLEELGAAIRSLLLAYDRLGAVSETVQRALRVLRSFTITLPGGAAFSVGVDPEVGVADSGLLRRDLTDLLVSTGQAAADRRSCAIVAIDELQYLNENEFAAIIMALHRTVQLDLPILLVGTGLPQLPALAGEAKSYAERLFAFPHIGSLDASSAREAILEPAQAHGVAFTDGAIALILSRTLGYPYFLQEWAHDAWNQGTENRVSEADIAAIQSNVEHRLDRDFFSVRFDRLTPQERQYLRALAELGTNARSGDVAATMARKVESVAPVREALIRKGMLYSPEYGITAFTVPLFDEFMKRALPLQTAGPSDQLDA